MSKLDYLLTKNPLKVWDIPGGVHPEQNKVQSNQSKIQTLPLFKQYVVPVSQHIGAGAKIIVEMGQTVLKGQVIGQAQGFISANVHAPTSGTVVAIENRAIAHPSGLQNICVIIEADQKDQWIEHQGLDDHLNQDNGLLVETIRNAGIVGLGGAGFPSDVKHRVEEDRIDTLIINGTECEPYITADDVLMREQAGKVIAGIKILQKILTPKRIFIGIEDNKPEAIAALKTMIETSKIDQCWVKVFPTKYPSGGEKQLIQILTGKQVPAGGLPADIGIVCQNVGTTAAIYDAIVLGKPLISRITTVTGDGASQKGNFETLIGTGIRDVLEHCQWQPNQTERVIMGGPMMGFTIENLASPVVKTTNCLLVAAKKELPVLDPANPCIRCGLCEQVCPVDLLPQQLHWFSKSKEFEKAEMNNLFDCIECGACSYVCPSQIPLVQYYRFAKGEIISERQAQKDSDRAKIRFEARQERLEAEAAAKEAKRKARAEKAAAAAKARENSGEVSPTDALIAAAKAKVAASKNKNTDPDTLKAAAEKAQAKVDKAAAKFKEASDNDWETAPALEKGLIKLKEKALIAQKAFDDASKNSAPNNQEQLKEKWDNALKKVSNAEAKLADAKENKPELVEAMERALGKFREKAQLAQKNYQEQAKSVEAESKETPKTDLAALKKAVETANLKHERAVKRLEQAKIESPDTVDAFEKAVVKFEQRQKQAQEALEQAKQETVN